MAYFDKGVKFPMMTISVKLKMHFFPSFVLRRLFVLLVHFSSREELVKQTQKINSIKIIYGYQNLDCDGLLWDTLFLMRLTAC